MSDVVTSAAVFVGVSIALMGEPGWESADDRAALLASGVTFLNGANLLRPALQEITVIVMLVLDGVFIYLVVAAVRGRPRPGQPSATR